MGVPYMFNNLFLTDTYIDENGNNCNIKTDASLVFKAKVLTFAKQGLKIEKIIAPPDDDNTYVFYVSCPEFLKDDNPYNDSVLNLTIDFKKWITRFMFCGYSDEEFYKLKANREFYIEVRNKIRKNEKWTEELGLMYAHAYIVSWNATESFGVEKMTEISNKIKQYFGDFSIDKFNNMSDEQKMELVEKYQKMLEDNPDLAEDLANFIGGLY